MIDLLSERAGGRVVDFNDEFFAEASNLIKINAPFWDAHAYTDRGKWMDGWETRRRRESGNDWCVLALGIPGRIRKVTVDTAHFTGNYPERFSLWGAGCGTDDVGDDEWVELIPPTKLEGDSVAELDVEDTHRVTHVRLDIFPDGGVARLRIMGDPIPGIDRVCPEGPVDLASMVLGGHTVDVSDKHYSDPFNMLRPTEPVGMWDGWETRRRRGPGHDWATIKLGMRGQVDVVEVDTRFFKGNAPGWVSLELSEDGDVWTEVVSREAVRPDSINRLELKKPATASFARLSIHPDGGVARFRVMGRADSRSAGPMRLAYLNSLFDRDAERFFRTACGSGRWVAGMVGSRPLPSIDGVFEAAERSFDALEEEDWLEAFASHPRIGDGSGPSMSRVEQSGVETSGDRVRADLAEVNREYEEKFGFIYIVKAEGKSGEEMLEIARSRLGNSRAEEISNAGMEQRKITTTRLRKMLCQEPM